MIILKYLLLAKEVWTINQTTEGM